MEEAVAVHVLYNLEEDGPFYNFAKDAEDCYRSVILGFKWIFFLMKRNNLGKLVERRKNCRLDRNVDNMGDCWQDVVHHELDDVGINVIHPT